MGEPTKIKATEFEPASPLKRHDVERTNEEQSDTDLSETREENNKEEQSNEATQHGNQTIKTNQIPTLFSKTNMEGTNYFTMNNKYLGFPAPPCKNFQLSERLLLNYRRKLIKSTSLLFKNLNRHLKRHQRRPTDTRHLKLHVQEFVANQKQEIIKLAKRHIELFHSELPSSTRRSICFGFKSRIFPLETALAIIMKKLPNRAFPDNMIKMFDELQAAPPRMLYLYNIQQTFQMGPSPKQSKTILRTIEVLEPTPRDDLTIQVQGALEERLHHEEETQQPRIASIAVKTKSFQELSFGSSLPSLNVDNHT